MTAFDFWFDFGSTYSYPAAMRVEKRAEGGGVAVAWRPFVLGAIFKADGWNDSPFNLYPAMGRYMWRDVERTCRAEGIPFRRPSRFPRNGLLASRIACWHEGAAWIPDFVRAVFVANFQHDLDIADAAVVGDCLAAVGQDAPSIIEQAAMPASKAKLRAQTDEAIRLGIFGAPFFIVDGEPFWGNDRLDQALAWHAARDTRAGP